MEEQGDDEGAFLDEQQQEDDEGALFWWIVGAFAIVVIAGTGFIGKVSGTGWFGYRQFMYGDGTLYALNLAEEDVVVSVDGREPSKLEPRQYKRFDLVGGTSAVTVEEGEDSHDYSVEIDGSHAFVKAAGDGCLAGVDVTGFYEDGEPAEDLKIIAKIGKDDRVWVPGTRNVIWPRESFPESISGGQKAVWLETVGCPLLEEPKYLNKYLQVKMNQRIEGEKATPTQKGMPVQP